MCDTPISLVRLYETSVLYILLLYAPGRNPGGYIERTTPTAITYILQVYALGLKTGGYIAIKIHRKHSPLQHLQTK